MAKRRANGEGSIRRKRNGRWEVQIMDGYKPDGRRNMRSFSGKTQKEAKEKRDEYLRKREAGLLTGREIRFDEWADIWFRNHADNTGYHGEGLSCACTGSDQDVAINWGVFHLILLVVKATGLYPLRRNRWPGGYVQRKQTFLSNI